MHEERGETTRRFGGRGLPLIRRTYDSVMDFYEDAKKGYPEYKADHSSFGEGFSRTFAGCNTWQEIEDLCRYGWMDNLPETLDLVEKAVKMVEREIEQVEPQHAVCGGDVDIAAAVAGLPHDMVEYPLTMVSNIGTTITICCDVQCYAGISAESVIRRGMVIVALALALDGAGHQTELWLSDEYTAGSSRAIFRTCVKGPNDYIDPAKLLYAYAHPSVQRGLGFCAVSGLPDPWNRIARQSYGTVSGITKDFPEGTLYIEPVHRVTNSSNLDTELRMYLTQLGLLADGE
jgi:hypothetical protein